LRDRTVPCFSILSHPREGCGERSQLYVLNLLRGATVRKYLKYLVFDELRAGLLR
jgi:hypothetical protein